MHPAGGGAARAGAHQQREQPPQALVTTLSLPVSNVKELVAYAKANPGKLNFASSGVGTPNHLGGEMLRYLAKIDIVHIAYKGGGPAPAALRSTRPSSSPSPPNRPTSGSRSAC